MHRVLASFGLALLLGCSSSTSAPDTTPDASKPVDAASGDTASDAKADTAPACDTGKTKCGSACVDVTSDTANCGACGKACGAEQTCTGGACACADGKAACGSACVDTQTSNDHCGGCGNACTGGSTCSEGKCQAPCPTGQSRCGGTCIDTTADTKNCGGCGKACGTGQSCVSSACACDYPTKLCSGSCVNVNFDVNNCGDCGKACPTGPKGIPGCTSGSCVLSCTAGYGNCNDVASDGCEVDLATNDKNCGTCGTACNSAESCVAGKCECKTGATKCGGVCVDVTSNDNNCGSCGHVCGSGESCVSSVCQCKTGFTRCGTACVDTKTDASNCGTCGTACGTGKTCSSGICCPAGQVSCGGVCKDTTSDPTNCGTCGTTCSGSTPYCSASACSATCPGGLTACSLACVNTSTDINNCGSCGNKCTAGTCVGGSCVTCTTGTITVDLPFSAMTGWTTSGCCTESNYRVAPGTGATVSGGFSDTIPSGSVVKTVTVKWGIEHACAADTNAMEFKLNGTTIGTWNSAKGPDCSCGDTRVGDASFSAPTTAYLPGASNTVSILHNYSGSCHEAITNVPSAPTGTAARVVITYGCP